MKKRESAQAFVISSIIVILIAFSREARAGAQNGISLCENVVIPSLLPILMLSRLLIGSRCAVVFEVLCGRVCERLLKVPRQAAGAVILGLLGGYPTGAVLTQTLYRQGTVSQQTATHIMRFNCCGGAAFIITAVGSVTYQSTKTGVLLLGVNIVAALITAAISAAVTKPEMPTREPFEKNRAAVGEALPDAAEATVKALALMAAFIMLFSAITAVLKPPQALLPLTEITAGVCAAAKPLPLPFAAFFLSFGGICIHFQLAGILQSMHIKYRDFLIGRIACGVLSYFLTKLYTAVFPHSDAVFNNIASPVFRYSQSGPILSMVMLVGCAVVVFDIENQKIKLHSTK